MLKLSAKSLAAALAPISKIIDKRSSIPVLTHVRLYSAPGQPAYVTGTDLDRFLTMEVQVAEGFATEAFDVCLPAQSLAAVLKGLAKDAVVALEVTSPAIPGVARDDQRNVKAVQPRCGSVRLTGDVDAVLPSFQADDFPRFVNRSPAEACFKMAGKELAEMVDKVSLCISTEETRYYLNGILLHLRNEKGGMRLAMAATDGHRLALIKTAVPDGAAALNQTIIPRLTVGDISRLFRKSEEVSIEVSATRITLSSPGAVLVSKLIDGTFPDYNRVIPGGNSKQATFNVEALKGACEAAKRTMGRQVRPVKVSLDNPQATIQSISAEGVGFRRQVPCQFAGEAFDVGFNTAYLADQCASIEADEMVMMFEDAGSPVLITDPANDNYLAVLMPMRV